MKKEIIKIDGLESFLHSADKLHGTEVSRGCGEHTPKQYKKKYKDKWKKETKEYI
jgi:hypothetical protein